jgi:hypothetical protein
MSSEEELDDDKKIDKKKGNVNYCWNSQGNQFECFCYIVVDSGSRSAIGLT